jgi:hypothetical protein
MILNPYKVSFSSQEICVAFATWRFTVVNLSTEAYHELYKSICTTMPYFLKIQLNITLLPTPKSLDILSFMSTPSEARTRGIYWHSYWVFLFQFVFVTIDFKCVVTWVISWLFLSGEMIMAVLLNQQSLSLLAAPNYCQLPTKNIRSVL